MSSGVKPALIRPRLAVPAVCLVLMGVVWLVREPILEQAGTFLDVGQPPQKADAILVLAGGKTGERILKAGELMRLGYAPVAYVSGPTTFYDMPECAASIPFAGRHGYPTASFRCIESGELSTAAEAQACCDVLRRAGVRKFLLVTTAFHTRRAAQTVPQVSARNWTLSPSPRRVPCSRTAIGSACAKPARRSSTSI